jgi:hypothetical protein
VHKGDSCSDGNHTVDFFLWRLLHLSLDEFLCCGLRHSLAAAVGNSMCASQILAIDCTPVVAVGCWLCRSYRSFGLWQFAIAIFTGHSVSLSLYFDWLRSVLVGDGSSGLRHACAAAVEGS